MTCSIFVFDSFSNIMSTKHPFTQSVIDIDENENGEKGFVGASAESRNIEMMIKDIATWIFWFLFVSCLIGFLCLWKRKRIPNNISKLVATRNRPSTPAVKPRNNVKKQ